MVQSVQSVQSIQSVASSRFGEISYSEEDVLFFPRGLPAFEKSRNWILTGEEDNAIKWLQNIEDCELALPVTTPDAVMPDYNAKIPEDELDLVGSKDPGDLALLIVVSLPESAPWDMTANLRAPILVNLKSRKAVQVIVLNEEYPVRHVVFPQNVRETMKASAANEGEF
jgi:flagellar assembly factor FliW